MPVNYWWPYSFAIIPTDLVKYGFVKLVFVLFHLVDILSFLVLQFHYSNCCCNKGRVLKNKLGLSWAKLSAA